MCLFRLAHLALATTHACQPHPSESAPARFAPRTCRAALRPQGRTQPGVANTNATESSKSMLACAGIIATCLFYLIQNQRRSEEHTSELQSLMRISYAVFCLKKKNKTHQNKNK